MEQKDNIYKIGIQTFKNLTNLYEKFDKSKFIWSEIKKSNKTEEIYI